MIESAKNYSNKTRIVDLINTSRIIHGIQQSFAISLPSLILNCPLARSGRIYFVGHLPLYFR